ncbi:TIGR00153 family protein [Ectothiorhodospira lacustris]|uniref:TIGR00153 family protein n=1 Tax=Ectothiorhodospira lacustris TaxID=2899127 RepID=UPI001EE81D3E|nr:TIGR00153 family protein [Ectothiorhodospira lacustris]MCG5501914.1 TIGR00153 family protein [Ectothiorhodospira lacustris]MCG5509453.1 TIGR00153 family protein [Ectothiorhodospira lacustris]MCG5521507.1 TIGR00153 family protein [Ectothiorhodospira lacustris]
MPPKSYFFDLFGKSPVRPLQLHAEKVQACVAELPAFMEAAMAQDWEQAEARRNRIAELEHEADLLKKDLRQHLPKGMMLAMSRRDVLEALTVQDGIANTAKDIAGLILGRRMTFPDNLHFLLRDFLGRSTEATRKASQAVHELEDLVETGFRGHEVDVMESILKELDTIEHDTDRIQIKVRAELFAMERSLPPVDVIFMYRIIDEIGDLADLAQRVGSRLRLMLAH